jgi:hypothetical protein
VAMMYPDVASFPRVDVIAVEAIRIEPAAEIRVPPRMVMVDSHAANETRSNSPEVGIPYPSVAVKAVIEKVSA